MTEQLLQIDLKEVLNAKLGKKARWVPGFVVRWLERTVRQKELNEILRLNHPKNGAEFCQGVFDYLNADIRVTNPEKFPSYGDRRVIFVSNHPLGGLDGMAIIAELTRRYGKGLRIVVNDILMVVKPLGDVFLPINKHGSQDRGAITDINTVLASEEPVVVFPAGLVSRRGKDGEIRDLRWNKMFVNKAIEFHRDVIPMFFSGENSPFFYKFAQWRERIGLKFNVEMVYLPSELLKSRDKTFEITLGDPISWQSLQKGPQALKQAQEVKEIVYSLKK